MSLTRLTPNNPITIEAACELLIKWEDYQRETRPRYKQGLDHEFAFGVQVLHAQGVGARRQQWELAKAVTDAYDEADKSPSHKGVSDIPAAARLRVGSTHRGLRRWEWDAVLAIVSRVNAPVQCEHEGCEEDSEADDPLCAAHMDEREAEAVRRDAELAELAESILKRKW